MTKSTSLLTAFAVLAVLVLGAAVVSTEFASAADDSAPVEPTPVTMLIMDQYGVYQIVNTSGVTLTDALQKANDDGIITAVISENTWGHSVDSINGLAQTADYSGFWSLYTFVNDTWVVSPVGIDTCPIDAPVGFFYVLQNAEWAVVAGGPEFLDDKIPSLSNNAWDGSTVGTLFELASYSGFTVKINGIVAPADESALASAAKEKTSWAINAGATADRAVVTETYLNSRGTLASDVTLTYTKCADIDDSYAKAVADLTARIGVDKAYMQNTYAAFEGAAIDGVRYSAISCSTSATTGSHYVKFVMAVGDVLIDGATCEKGSYFYNADYTIQEFLEMMAGTVDTDVKSDATVLDAFTEATDYYQIPVVLTANGVDTVFGMWSSSDSEDIYDDFGTQLGSKYTYWMQYVKKDGQWAVADKYMSGLSAAENPEFKLAVNDYVYMYAPLVDVEFDPIAGLRFLKVDIMTDEVTPVESIQTYPGSGIVVYDDGNLAELCFFLSETERYFALFTVNGVNARFVDEDGVAIESGDPYMSDFGVITLDADDIPAANCDNAKYLATYIAANFKDTTGAAVSITVDDGATADRAVISYCYKNSKGVETTVKFTVTKETDIDAAFATAVQTVSGYVGKASMGSVYEVVDHPVDGIAYAAAFLPLSSSSMTKFAVAAGDVLITTDKYLYLAGTESEPVAYQFLDVVGEAFALTPAPVLFMDQYGVFTVTDSYGANLTEALIDLNERDVMSIDVKETTWGHSVDAVNGLAQTADYSGYWSLYYLDNGAWIMSDYGIDKCTFDKVYGFFYVLQDATWTVTAGGPENLADKIPAVTTVKPWRGDDDGVLFTLTSDSGFSVYINGRVADDATVLDAFKVATTTYSVPAVLTSSGVDTVFGLWSSKDSEEICDDYENTMGYAYTYWMQYVKKDGQWIVADKYMSGLSAAENPEFKLAVGEFDWYMSDLVDVSMDATAVNVSYTFTEGDKAPVSVDNAKVRVGSGMTVTEDNGAIAVVFYATKDSYYTMTVTAIEGCDLVCITDDGVEIESGDCYMSDSALAASVSVTVSIVAGDHGYIEGAGPVNFSVPYGAAVVTDGAKITVGESSFTAVASPAIEGTIFSFDKWAVIGDDDKVPATITAPTAIRAVFLSTFVPKADETGKVDIDVSGSTDVAVVIPAETTTVTISDSSSNVSVNVADASEIKGKTVTKFAIEAVEAPAQKAGQAYEFNFEVEGAVYNGTMVVSVPYTAVEGKTPVVYFNDNGNFVKMKTVSTADGVISFETNHNSMYIVVNETPAHDDLNKDVMFVVALAVVVVVFGIAIFAIVRRNDEYY